MDPQERAWQETQRRMLQTGQWVDPAVGGSSSGAPGAPATPPPPTPVPSLDDAIAARQSRHDAEQRRDSESVFRLVNAIDSNAVSIFWSAFRWKVVDIPLSYRPVVADFLARVPPGRFDSGWLVLDDLTGAPTMEWLGLLPRTAVSTSAEWWDFKRRNRRRRCVELLDERAERVRYVSIPVETTGSEGFIHYMAFLEDGVRCVRDDGSAEHHLTTNPSAITGHMAAYLSGGS